MTEFAIEIVIQTSSEPSDEMFTRVADSFFDLDGLEDQDVAANGSTIEFRMTVVARDEVDGLMQAMSAVRTAIHAAGGATPGWESHVETLRTVIEREPHALTTTRG